jgi:hypothetical protein
MQSAVVFMPSGLGDLTLEVWVFDLARLIGYPLCEYAWLDK